MDNLLSKLTRLHVEERSFTPDGSREPIRYNALFCQLNLEVSLKLSHRKISNKSMRVFYFCSITCQRSCTIGLQTYNIDKSNNKVYNI